MGMGPEVLNSPIPVSIYAICDPSPKSCGGVTILVTRRSLGHETLKFSGVELPDARLDLASLCDPQTSVLNPSLLRRRPWPMLAEKPSVEPVRFSVTVPGRAAELALAGGSTSKL